MWFKDDLTLWVRSSHAPILPSLVAISIELVAIFSKTYAISCLHTKFQHVDTVICQGLHEAHLVLVTRVYTTTDGRHAKNFYQSIQKHRSEKRQSLGRLKRLCSEPSAQTHHPAEFNGHRSCKSREIVTWPYFGLVIKNRVNLKVDRRYWSGDMFLVCHVISQDHLIKGSCDVRVRAPRGK